jgi:uncharacterized lipoprotein NlpE involved in copper resistance
MSIKTMPVTTERLEMINKTASDIIQKTAEAVGTLKMLEMTLEEHEKFFQSNELWALRNAIRNIEATTDDAADITETIDQFKEI